MKKLIIFVLMLLLLPLVSAEEIVVGVKPAAPFVMVGDDNSVSGFSIDLIEQLVLQVDPNLTIVYKIDPDLKTHLQTVTDGKEDIGIAATTITSEREKMMDFSYPFYRASLGILLLESESKKSMWHIFMSKKLLTVLLIILSYLLIVSHLIWFIERGHDNFSKEYAKGIVQGVWWAVVTMSTVGYGDFAPKRFWGRALGILIIFSGIILFGFAIAVLSSVFTVSQLQTSISGVDDLAGHSVAVIDGSVAQKAMSRYGVQQVSVATFKEGIAKIENKEADAFVHDTPMLQYYIKNNPGFILAERAFEPSDYGMTFPEGSRYREEFNRALLKSMEGDGSEYDKLRQKWFG